MDHPRPWLRILNADDLDDSAVDFGKLAVTTPSGDKLGKVDGFVVDVDSGRPVLRRRGRERLVQDQALPAAYRPRATR